MPMDPVTQYALTLALTYVPYILVVLAGVAIAIVRWQRHPRVSLAVLIAAAINITMVLAAVVWQLLSLQWMMTSAYTPGPFQAMAFYTVYGTVQLLTGCLTLYAIFSGRAPSMSSETSLGDREDVLLTPASSAIVQA